MPYDIRKLPNQELYRVYNKQTKAVHSYATTLENAKKQLGLLYMIEKKGGNFEEDGEPLKPFFGRVGSKFSLIKDIIPIIPPHSTYVEAFVGGGSIFWNKEPAKKSVINDLDKDLVDGYKLLKKIPLNADLTKYDGGWNDKPQIKKLNEIFSKINSSSSTTDRLIKQFKLSRGTFNAIGKGLLYSNKDCKPYIARLPEYKRLLKNTTITNQNYISVIKKYDSPTTFFYLDPPYEESKGLYSNDTIDYNEMNDVLKNIKGKFLLSINDSKEIAEFFKGFNQKKVSVTNSSNAPGLETKNRKELFISNYDIKPKVASLKKGGSVETDDFKSDGIVSLPEFRSVKINLPTYMYKRLPDIKGKPPPYRYRLVVPITSSRNISSRKKATSLDISQKAVVKPVVDITENEEQVFLKDFSPADKLKIQQYYNKVEENERKNPDEIDKDDYQVIPRGKPLPCSKASSSSSSSSSNKTPNVRLMVADIETKGSFAEKAIPKPVSTSSKKQSKEDEELLDNDFEAFFNKSLAELKPNKKKSGKGLENIILSNSKMANSWIEYVKAFCAKNGMSYRDALRSPECKAGYKKGGKLMNPFGGGGVVDELGNQPILAKKFNVRQLGANAGKSFVSL